MRTPDYEAARQKYRPDEIKTLFIAEAPPDNAERFFFFEEVRDHDALFWEVMKVLYGVSEPDRPRKKDYLGRFKRDGYYLVDACLLPIAQRQSKKKQIRDSLSSLITRAGEICDSDTKLVLIGSPVYEVCQKPLRDNGFGVMNTEMIPNPAYGHAEEFRTKLAKVLNMQKNPLVSIVMGSDSDLDIMNEAAKALAEFGIPYEIDITSAHRSPARTSEYSRGLKARGVEVVIAGAGGAAHLAGVIAAETTLPVIAVPIPSTALLGLDSLLAMVQMPAGIPVATVAIGKPGATNAGILAAQMIGLHDAEAAKKLEAHKEKLAKGVEAKSKKLKESHRG